MFDLARPPPFWAISFRSYVGIDTDPSFSIKQKLFIDLSAPLAYACCRVTKLLRRNGINNGHFDRVIAPL